MHSVFSRQTISQIEQDFVCEQGIESFELMLRAGRAAFSHVTRLYPHAKNIAVVTGAGNNAGDALIVAKLAYEQGLQVTLHPLKAYQEFSGDAGKAWKSVKPFSLPMLACQKQDFCQADLIIDGLLGSGLKGELRPAYRQAINEINVSNKPVLALDLPSGTYADSGQVADVCVKADNTISFIAPKLSQTIDQSLAYQGQLCLESLGIPAEYLINYQPLGMHQSLADALGFVPKRLATTYKNECGHLLCIGGNHNMGGAIILSAETALKAGAGMVTCRLEPSNKLAGLSRVPEIMWQASRGKDEPSYQAAEDLERQTYDALVLGPGLGRDEWAKAEYQHWIKSELPKVIDADALFWLAQTAPNSLSGSILTPHIGEAARLLSWDTAKVKQDRIKAAHEIAKQYACVCILKGAGTIITDGQQTYIGAGAHPAMATAGLGDLLSGLLGALLAQGLEPLNAARLAVELHFQAGVEAANGRSRGVCASELIERINYWINK